LDVANLKIRSAVQELVQQALKDQRARYIKYLRVVRKWTRHDIQMMIDISAVELQSVFDEANPTLAKRREKILQGYYIAKGDVAPLRLPLECMEFPVHISRVLEENFPKDTDLLELACMTREELLDIRGIGKQSIKEIRKELANAGLDLYSNMEAGEEDV
jgi:DNA-directed RNA polymerase alpha subunit